MGLGLRVRVRVRVRVGSPPSEKRSRFGLGALGCSSWLG